MDITGFRRMRTIGQLVFESTPQFFFQIYILFRLKDYEEDRDIVTKQSLGFSLGFLILHVILELIFILLGAKASESGFIFYFFTCYSGRLNWVPFIHKLSAISGKNECIKFDNIVYTTRCA